MSELVKDELKRLIETHGKALCLDINRLKGLLYDVCPLHRKERNVLVLAMQEGLTGELKRGAVSEIHLRPLASRLHEAAGIDKGLAEWAIGAWAEALGVGLHPKTPHCSFCHKSQHEVPLLGGDSLALICEECIKSYMDIIRDRRISTAERENRALRDRNLRFVEKLKELVQQNQGTYQLLEEYELGFSGAYTVREELRSRGADSVPVVPRITYLHPQSRGDIYDIIDELEHMAKRL